MCWVLLLTAGPRRAPAENSTARGERGGSEATLLVRPSAGRRGRSGRRTGADDEEEQPPQPARMWGLRALLQDGRVPISRIISDFISRHFPHVPSSLTPSFALEPRRPNPGEDAGVTDDLPSLFAEGRA